MEKILTSFFLLLQYVMASSAMTQTNITIDQLALLSLKSQIISDPFHFLDESWSPAISVCRWVGVTCGSRYQRVKSLNLSNMTLTGTIPPDFGNLTFLVSLDLGRNNFHGNLPQEMARLHQLKFLDLHLNNFRGEVHSWFGFLHQLQYLTLGSNSFIGSIPPSLSNASRLESLVISANLLQGNILEEIGNLHNLKYLYIEDNQFTGSIPSTIFNISKSFFFNQESILHLLINCLTVEYGLDCHTPSLYPGRDRHSKTIAGPERTLGLAFLTQRKLNSTAHLNATKGYKTTN